MPGDSPSPLLVDAAKASVSKLKEKQAALDARAKELDALKARLEQERTDLKDQAAKLAAERSAIVQERQGLDDVRASLERDLAVINEGRERLTKDEESLHRALQNLEERERVLKADEERVQRLQANFVGPFKDSESGLHDLMEHEKELVKLQAEWLTALEARQKELQEISTQTQARQSEVLHQHESLIALRNELKGELGRLMAEHDRLTAKEKSILDAEEALAAALELGGTDAPAEVAPAAIPPPAPTPPEVAPPPAAPEPMPQPEPEPEPQPEAAPAPAPDAALVTEEIPREPEPKPRPTKGEVSERLSKAVEAWKRARDAGWKVSDIRKTVKVAKDALETGDYERANRCATEILEGLQATAAAR